MDRIRQKISEEIKRSGIGTGELAEKLGVTAGMISQYRNASKLPSLETFVSLCKVLGVSSDYILGIKD